MTSLEKLLNEMIELGDAHPSTPPVLTLVVEYGGRRYEIKITEIGQ